MRHLKNQRGFTLMELMVVIVIVAILAAVAVPLYINYVKDATRTEAKGAIGAVITAEQTNFQNTGTYVAVSDADFAALTKLNCDLTESRHNWSFAVSDADAAGFTVTATGRTGTQAAGLTVVYQYSRASGGVWDPVPAGPGTN